MIKSELVTRLAAKNPHLYQKEVEGVVNTVLGEIGQALKEHNRVELRGFGAFSVRVRGARIGRNPRTGQAVEVAEKAAPFFRAGKEMRDRINANRPVTKKKSSGGSSDKTSTRSATKALGASKRRSGSLKDAAE